MRNVSTILGAFPPTGTRERERERPPPPAVSRDAGGRLRILSYRECLTNTWMTLRTGACLPSCVSPQICPCHELPRALGWEAHLPWGSPGSDGLERLTWYAAGMGSGRVFPGTGNPGLVLMSRL